MIKHRFKKFEPTFKMLRKKQYMTLITCVVNNEE